MPLIETIKILPEYGESDLDRIITALKFKIGRSCSKQISSDTLLTNDTTRSTMNEHNHRSILNSNILSQIENHAIENDGFSLKLLGFADEITVNAYAFPSSFDDDETQSQLKKLKYKSSVHLLNAAYRKLGITELSKADIKKCIAGELEYWYLDISFGTPILPELQNHYKTQNHNFMIFLGDPEPGDDAAEDGLRILYTSQLIFNYVQEFDRAIYLNLDATDLDEKYQTAISQLKSVIYGICKTIEVKIPQDLQSETLDRLIIAPPTLETFKSLLKLLTRNKYEDKEYQKDAKKLQTFSKKVVDEFEMHCKIRDMLDRHDAIYYSDWKFDPEDIEYGFSTILDEEFTFEYPEETYSQNLFPYLHTELAKKELKMLNIDTGGDSYLFCIVNIADVDSVLELAQSIDLSIEKI
jgi:hypothetical protein